VPKTTVVVVTWRGRELVGACLDALASQTAPHAVLVVDNASDDGTAAVLGAAEAGRHGELRVLRLPRNSGYAGGLAAALPQVRTPYVGWLNDDAAPQPGWLASLEAALDASPEVAAAGSLLLSAEGSVQSAGVRLTALGYGRDATEPPSDGVFAFCGGAALLRTDVLRSAGGVPAPFFCYYEDTDTSWRLRLAGHEVRTVPGAVVRHRHGASSRLGSSAFHRWNERNRLLMLVRCAPAGVAARELARFAAITAAVPFRRRGRGGSNQRPAPNHRVALRLLVLAAVTARLPATLVQRAAIGRRTTVPRRQVWRRWAGR
jgi:GT2 family glycosyltransferase